VAPSIGLSEEETVSLVKACGWNIEDFTKNRSPDWREHFQKWRQQSPLGWHDVLRANRLRRDLMQAGNSTLDPQEIERQIALRKQKSLELKKRLEQQREEQERLRKEALAKELAEAEAER
jgi:hypothetical protein